ncbi:MAG: HhH-GPD family protein [Acidimicrobiales bacterium]
MTPAPGGAGTRRLRRAVLAVTPALRALPWRATRDPWAVLVSELMLQQTQLSRVLGPYEAFVERFPTPAACAAAPLGEVLRAWAGLGYNRRAAQLHGAARAMVERHGGRVPEDLAALLALPGIGPYTARAVLAFAYEHDVGVVDTNVRRVIERAVAGRSVARREEQSLADELVPRGRSWAWNQSLMEIGARWCTARRPRCDDCPLARSCGWRASGPAVPDPATAPRGQSTFAGSDRQGRGRLVAALRSGHVASTAVPVVCGWPDDPERARRVADGLVAEGLARRGRGGALNLP